MAQAHGSRFGKNVIFKAMVWKPMVHGSLDGWNHGWRVAYRALGWKRLDGWVSVKGGFRNLVTKAIN